MASKATQINRRRTLKGIAAAGAGAALAAGGPITPMGARKNKPKRKDKPSLYERLGGIFAIAAVVDRFSDAIITNPKLNVNPALRAWNETEAATRLPGLKVMRTIWIASMAGGPFEYTGLPLEDAHREFNLTAEEFAEVGAEIVRALEHFEVPEREIRELVATYRQSMSEVVSSSP